MSSGKEVKTESGRELKAGSAAQWVVLPIWALGFDFQYLPKTKQKWKIIKRNVTQYENMCVELKREDQKQIRLVAGT